MIESDVRAFQSSLKCRFFDPSCNLVPRVFSLFKMAAAREKTLAHSRSRVSNEDGDVFKMAATAKNRVWDAKVKINKMAEKAEVQFKKK